MSKWALGIDLGGTAVKIAVIDEDGNMLLHERHDTRIEQGAEGVVRQIASLAFSLYKEAGQQLEKERFTGIGLGAPGAVNREQGILSYPPNLPGWKQYPLQNALQTILFRDYAIDCPLILENDANVAAFGEAVFGAGKDVSDFMMITLGTGVGGGIILNRELYRGARGTAGEIGFLTIDYSGKQVHAGIRGTVESLIGKKGIVALGRDIYRRNPREPRSEELHGQNLQNLSPKTLQQAAEQGDPLAKEVWRTVGTLLGVGLAGVVALLDIRTFIIGGGVAGAGDLIFSPALEQIKRSTLPSMHDGLKLLPAALGNRAGVYGAAALGFSSLA